MPYLQPSTWRHLGFSVGLGYVGFGLFEILFPNKAGKELLDIEPGRSPEVDRTVSLLAPLMGARDLTVAAAIFTFYHNRQDREMGIIILAGTILCYADAIAIGFKKGLVPALQVLTGSSIWAGVGAVLMSNSTVTVPGK